MRIRFLSFVLALLVIPACGDDVTGPVDTRVIDDTHDDAPGGAILDLRVVSTGPDRVVLEWTVPDLGAAVLKQYDVRYDANSITEETFEVASRFDCGLTPGSPGSKESCIVTGLLPDAAYYFAIRSEDSDGNLSAVSNSPATPTRVEAGTWVVYTTEPVVGGGIARLFDYRGSLVAAGGFIGSEGFSLPGIARWNGVRWEALADDRAINHEVMAQQGDNLYASSREYGRIHRYDGFRWEGPTVGNTSGFFALRSRRITAIHPLKNGEVVVLGEGLFLAEWTSRYRAVRWDGSSWTPFVGEDWYVNAMTQTANGDFLLAGQFLDVFPSPWSGVIRWDGRDAVEPLGGLITGSGGIAGIFWAIEEFEGRVVIAGDFDFVNGTSPITNPAVWDGASWQPFGNPLGDLGGFRGFTQFRGQMLTSDNAGFLVRLENGNWSRLGEMTNATTLLVRNGELFAPLIPNFTVSRWVE